MDNPLRILVPYLGMSLTPTLDSAAPRARLSPVHVAQMQKENHSQVIRWGENHSQDADVGGAATRAQRGGGGEAGKDHRPCR